MVLAATNAYAQYCVPVAGATAACTNGIQTMRINGVTTTGGLLNINNNNNTCSGYTYYTGTNNIIRQNAGGNVSMSIAQQSNTVANYTYRVVVWVDWNRDGVFNNTNYSITNPQGEKMLVSPDSPTPANPYVASFTVPLNAKNGLTRMRIRAGTRGGTTPVYQPNILSGTDPCAAGDYAYGEVEDYDFEVINPCTAPATVNFNNLTDRSVSITWSPRPNAIFYEYQVTTIQGFPASGNHYTTYTTVNLPETSIPIQCDTKYYVYIRSICDTGTGGMPEYLWDKSAWREETFTTPPCCYTPPVVINYISATSAVASWTPVPSVIKYEYAITADPSTIPPQAGYKTTQTSVLLTGLSPKQDYRFWLRAWCSPTPTSDWGSATFLTQPGSGLGIANTSADGNDIYVYPNPVKDIVTIAIPGTISGNSHLVITDMLGKTVKSVIVTSNKQEVNMSGLANGMYHVKYTDAHHTSVKSIYKQ